MDCVSLIYSMTRISASIAALEDSIPLGSSSSNYLCLGQEPASFPKGCFLVAITLLLFLGIVSLSVLAKDGLYYPQTSAAHRISKASKMSQHQIPELGNERQEFVQAFPDVSGNINEGLQFNDGQETILPRDAAVLACPPLRSPPRH